MIADVVDTTQGSGFEVLASSIAVIEGDYLPTQCSRIFLTRGEDQIPVHVLTWPASGKPEGAKAVAALPLQAVTWAQNTTSLGMLVGNPGPDAVAVSLAIKSGPGWTYQETPAVEVPGHARSLPLTFDFKATTFRGANTAWQPTGALTDAKDIKAIFLVVQTKGIAGTLAFHQIGGHQRYSDVGVALQAEMLVGRWAWFNGGVSVFQPGGVCAGAPLTEHHWVYEPETDTYAISWSGGRFTDRMQMTRDGKWLVGKNQRGTVVWGNRLP